MTSPAHPPVFYWRFSALALVWLAVAYWVGKQFPTWPFGLVVVSVLIFAIPVALSGVYTSAVNQTHTVSYYRTSGRAYKLLSGRIIRSTLWVLWALATSFFMLLQFSLYSLLEWGALLLVIPVYWLVYLKSYRFLSGELRKRYVLTNVSIQWARWGCPVIMVVLYGVLIFVFAKAEDYASISEALAAKRTGVPETAGSAVAQAGLRLMTLTDGIKSYLVGDLLLKLIGGFVVFFNACATLACFVLPLREYRRVFGPISDDDPPPLLTKSRVASASALITFVLLFVYVPFFAQLEEWAPKVGQTIEEAERAAERIDGQLYHPGTLDKIAAAKAVALGKLDVSRARLEGQVDRAFDRVEGNVDRYLDWYYSLAAEYARLAKLMTGEIEEYMKNALHEKLGQGEAFKEVSGAMSVALESNKAVMEDYRKTVAAIMDASRLHLPPRAEAKVVKEMSVSDILSMPNHVDVVGPESRAGGGAVGAGISAAIAAKVASKGVFKAAAKVFSKAIVSKAGAALGGAAVGAAIGSVIPFIGTAVGGAIGAVIGGLAIDGALLSLEEAISRGEFRKEILSAIREARAAFKEQLFGATVPAPHGGSSH